MNVQVNYYLKCTRESYEWKKIPSLPRINFALFLTEAGKAEKQGEHERECSTTVSFCVVAVRLELTHSTATCSSVELLCRLL